MNFDMYSNKQHNDDLDANYIYPRPYIDPMMYVNSYGMQMNPNMMGGYMTYMNPYMNNPFMYQNPNDLDEYDDDEDFQDDMYANMMQQQMQIAYDAWYDSTSNDANDDADDEWTNATYDALHDDAWNESYDALYDDAWNDTYKYGRI